MAPNISTASIRRCKLDSAGDALSLSAAKHLANAMCYDDMIRVSDLKTRSKRDAAHQSRGWRGGWTRSCNLPSISIPRIEEFCGTLPAGLGRYIESRPKLSAWLDRRVNRGRRIRTDSMSGFALLWFIGGLRRWRRSLLRHQVEMEHLQHWYKLALDHVSAEHYALAVEILNCRRLIKGYSDTHVRAFSKFDRVLSGLDLVKGRPDAADWIRRSARSCIERRKRYHARWCPEDRSPHWTTRRITAVASISTSARSSSRATTCTSVIAG